MRARLITFVLILNGLFGVFSTCYAWPLPPDAALTADTDFGVIGQSITVTFDGTGSVSMHGTGGINGIHRFEWDFDNDGVSDYNETPTFYPDGAFDGMHALTYSQTGDYVITLKVYNIEEEMGSATFELGIRDTIQEAIDDASVTGDVITVTPATYTGTGNRDVSFSGKAVEVRSIDPNDHAVVVATIIDCNGSSSDLHRGFLFTNLEGPNSKLRGFTVINGYSTEGGAVKCSSSTPTIADCMFTDNTASSRGGAIHIYLSNPKIKNCVFMQNTAISEGGGVSILDGSPEIVNCVFRENSSDSLGGGIYARYSYASKLINCLLIGNTADYGGGIYTRDSSPTIVNCTFNANDAISKGGGIRNYSASSTITNSILWGNTSPVEKEIASASSANLVVSYCDVEGGFAGPNNVDSDPGFVDADNPAGPDNIFGTRDDGLNIRGDSPYSCCVDSGNEAAELSNIITDITKTSKRCSDADHDGLPIPDRGCYEAIPSWYVKADATGSQDGSSWEHACKYLQDVLTTYGEPEGLKDGDVIWVAEGIYRPDQGNGRDPDSQGETFELVNNVAIYGGFKGVSGECLCDRDWTKNKTILSGEIGNWGSLDNSNNVVTGAAIEGAVLDGLIVGGGNADGAGSDAWGGGMTFVLSYVEVKNCTIEHNRAVEGGGVSNQTANINFTDCVFRNNYATESAGGAMRNRSTNSLIERCTFEYNKSTDAYGYGYGGAVFNDLTDDATFKECLFKTNTAGDDYGRGGAIYNLGASPTLIGCVFAENKTGTHYYVDSSDETLNGYYGWGGGVYNAPGSDPSLINCVFIGNIAPDGGGMYNSGSSPKLTNCTFTMNTAFDVGGAMYSAESSNPLIRNCILWGDTAQTDGEIHNDDSTPSIGHCDIEECLDSGGVLKGTFGGDLGDNIDVDPQFIMSIDEGSAIGPDGVFGTHDDGLVLALDSPCIDAGDNGAVPIDVKGDIVGKLRTVDGNHDEDEAGANVFVDMGAYELPRIWFVDGDKYDLQDPSGHSWENPYSDLQDALKSDKLTPNDLRSGDEIWVAEVTNGENERTCYIPHASNREISFELYSGVALYGGFHGDGDGDEGEPGWRMRNWEENETILSGDLAGDDGPDFLNYGDNSYHIVLASEKITDAVLDGFTIRGGNANGASSFDNCGGGIFSFHASPLIRNCTFINNSSTVSGGGMYAYNYGIRWRARPQLVNCQFKENYSINGGGLSVYDCSVTITKCDFTDNQAVNAGGQATNGGGMAITGTNMFGSRSALSGCTFKGNTARLGGGIFIEIASPVLTDCTFNENEAFESGDTSYGGAVYCAQSASRLINCIVTENSAGSGGGGFLSSHSFPTLVNCLIAGNVVSNGEGGGMHSSNDVDNLNPTLTNCVFAENKATSGYGGGIYNENSAPTLTNCILWGNVDSGPNVEFEQIYGGAPSINYCCIEGFSTYGGTDNYGSDPRFVDGEGWNGSIWEGGDWTLRKVSPYLDLGENSAVPFNVGTDLAGRTRIEGPYVDRGAYEMSYHTDATVDAGGVYRVEMSFPYQPYQQPAYVDLHGTKCDPNDKITCTQWQVLSTPDNYKAEITNAYSLEPTVELSMIDPLLNPDVNPRMPFKLQLVGKSDCTFYSPVISSSIATIFIEPIRDNEPPTVRANGPYEVTLPNSLPLNGEVTDDGLPAHGSLVSLWTVEIAEPGGTVNFTDPTDPKTTATFSKAGEYTLKLEAFDSLPDDPEKKEDSETAHVTVYDDLTVNKPPIVDAGDDRSAEIPTGSTSVQINLADNSSGAYRLPSVTDDYLVIDPPTDPPTIKWRVISPDEDKLTVGIVPDDAVQPVVTFNKAGTYVLELSAFDGIFRESDEVIIFVSDDKLDVYADEDRTVALKGDPGSRSVEVTLANAYAKAGKYPPAPPPNGFTFGWRQLKPTLNSDDPTPVGDAWKTQEKPTLTFTEAGVCELELWAKDAEGDPEVTDTVIIAVEDTEGVGDDFNRSLYVLTPQELHAYKILGRTQGSALDPEPQAILNSSSLPNHKSADYFELGPIRMAIDNESGYLFVTYGRTGGIELIDAQTLTPEGFIITPGCEDNLLGIVYDHDKRRLYATDRDSPFLYVYKWDSANKRLILDGEPVRLTEGAGGDEIDCEELALDEVSGRLYVADSDLINEYSANPGQPDVCVYGTNDWDYKLTEVICRLGEEDYHLTPNKGMDVYNDGQNDSQGVRYLYAGAAFGTDDHFVRQNLNTPQSLGELNVWSPYGVAVDKDTGLVYVAGASWLQAYDGLVSDWQNLQSLQDPIPYIRGPGIVVGRGVAYRKPIFWSPNPAVVSDSLPSYQSSPTIVSPVDPAANTITYTIEYDAGSVLYGAQAVVRLSREVDFVEAWATADVGSDSFHAIYYPETRTVVWRWKPEDYDPESELLPLLPVGPPGQGDLYLKVRANRCAKPGGKITNYCYLEGRVEVSANTYELRREGLVIETSVDCWGENEVIYVNELATGCDNGKSWEDAYLNLKDALDDAEARRSAGSLSGNQIWVAKGTISTATVFTSGDSESDGIKMVAGVKMYGGFDGTEERIDQRDPEGRTILVGDDLANPVITGANDSLLNGFTIRTHKEGASLVGYHIISNATVSNCNLETSGTGIYNTGSVNIAVSNCVINARNGIDCEDFADENGSQCQVGSSANMTVSDCIFTKPVNSIDQAIGVQAKDKWTCYVADTDVVVEILDCTFNDYDWGIVSGHDHTEWGATHLIVSGCVVSAAGESGILCVGDTWADISGCTINGASTGIKCASNSGAQYQYPATGTTIFNCIIDSSSVGIESSETPLEIKNNLIYDTSESSDSWGIKITPWDGDPEQREIWNNTIVRKGGIEILNNGNQDIPEVTNCILWCDTPLGGLFTFDQTTHIIPTEPIDYTSLVIYNCIQYWQEGDGGAGNSGNNPLFVQGDDRYHLDSGSPCIDKGHDTLDYSNQLDIDGGPRVVDTPSVDGDGVDIGADEFGSSVVTVEAGADKHIPITSDPLIIELDDAYVIADDLKRYAGDVRVDWSCGERPAGAVVTFLDHLGRGPDDPEYDPMVKAIARFESPVKVGMYEFTLVVKEDDGAEYVEIGSDTVTITLELGVATSADRDLTLSNAYQGLKMITPAINGTSTGDVPEGESIEWKWVQMSGPSTVTFVPPNQTSTSARVLYPKAGLYELKLLAYRSGTPELIGSDSMWLNLRYRDVTADAGDYPDVVKLAKNEEAELDLQGIVEGLTPDYVKWKGSKGVTFDNAAELATTAKFTEPGTYRIRLLAYTEADGLIGGDIADVVVAYTQVKIDAGKDMLYGTEDRAVHSPQDIVFLDGRVSGLPVGATYSWHAARNGLAEMVEFANARDGGTMVRFKESPIRNGIYEFVLAIEDEFGQVIDANSVKVEFVDGTGTYPGARANVPKNPSDPDDYRIIWPDLSEDAIGTVTDLSGYDVQWLGPDSAPLTPAEYIPDDQWKTTATFSGLGTYRLALLVTDNGIPVSVDNVWFTVDPWADNKLHAGLDGACTLKADLIAVGATANLYGKYDEEHLPDGVIAEWIGPDSVTFADGLPWEATTATFYESGVRTLTLQARFGDDVLDSDTVELTAYQPDVTIMLDNKTQPFDTLQSFPVSVSVPIGLVGDESGVIHYEISVTDYEGEVTDPTVTFSDNGSSSREAPLPIQTGPPDTIGLNFPGFGVYYLLIKALDEDLNVVGHDTAKVKIDYLMPLDVDAGDNLLELWLSGGYVQLTIDGIVSPPGAQAWWEDENGQEIPNPENPDDLDVELEVARTYEFTLRGERGPSTDHDTVRVIVHPEIRVASAIPGRYPSRIADQYGYATLDLRNAGAYASFPKRTEWSDVTYPDLGTVTFYDAINMVQPHVVFKLDDPTEAQDFTLQLAVYFFMDTGHTNPIAAETTTVTVLPFGSTIEDIPDHELDHTPPSLEFTATQGSVPIPNLHEDPDGGSVYGWIDIDVEARDDESGIAELELLLDEEEIEPIIEIQSTAPYPDGLYPDRVPIKNRRLHTASIEGDNPHFLKVRTRNAADAATGGDYVQKEIKFNIRGPEGSDRAYAEITDVSETGAVTGSAYMPPCDGGEIMYRVELFLPDVASYSVEDWTQFRSNPPQYEGWFVKDLVPSPDAEGFCSATEINEGSLVESVNLMDVPNGNYFVRLTVKEEGASVEQYGYDYALFSLSSPSELGNVKFSQEDLVIPVGGFPLRVVRTYDSRSRDIDGDFGHGWTYAIAGMDMEIHERREDLKGHELSGADITSVRMDDNDNRDVTVTLPDGTRATFDFYLDYEEASIYNYGDVSGYVAKFHSPAGVTATLKTKDRELMWSATSTWNGRQDLGHSIELDAMMYDFSGYILETADGTEYHFDRSDYGKEETFIYNYIDVSTRPRGPKPYLTKIITPTGDKIELNTNLWNGEIGQDPYKNKGAIEHYQKYEDHTYNLTKSVKIEYEDGHITKIWAPSEVGGPATLKYTYDPVYRNLTHVHKLVEIPQDNPNGRYEIIEYVYGPSGGVSTLAVKPEDHYITDIIDPRGLRPIRYEYDLDGLLTGLYDAKNNYIELKHDLGNRVEKVKDRNGIWTYNYYDPRGNITAVTQGLTDTDQKIVTVYKYEDAAYPDKPSMVKVPLVEDPQEDAHYSITKYKYDEQGRATIVEDPVGNVTTNSYDELGNPLQTIQWRPDNETAVFPEDFPTVNPTQHTKVSETFNEYYYEVSGSFQVGGGQGNPTGLPANTVIYDDAGQALERTSYFYDDHRRISQIVKSANPANPINNPAGINYDLDVVTQYSYNEASGSSTQPYSITDAAGSMRYFHYNENDSQDATWYYWDEPGSNPETYDKRVLTISDYDDAGRVVRTRRITDDNVDHTAPDLTAYLAGDDGVVLSKTEYNGIGKPKVTIDQYGVTTKYEYDETGNLIETIVYGSYQDYEICYPIYDDPDFGADRYLGVLTVSRTLYDEEGRTLLTVGPHDPYEPANGTETVYDIFGRVVETRRWKNVKVFLEDLNDDGRKVGRKVQGVLKPVNASAATPEDIAWTSEDKIPLVTTSTPMPGENVGPLSYSRTIYDPAGRVKHTTTLGELVVEVDQQWYVVTGEQPTTYDYDVAGRQIAVTDPCGHDFYNTDYALYVDGYILYNETQPIQIDFDHFDYNVYHEAEHPTGNFTGTHKTVTGYDGTRRDHVIDARAYEDGSAGEDAYKTQFEYDSLGRVTKTIHPPTVVAEGGAGQVPTYTHVHYDSLGRKDWESETTTEGVQSQVLERQKKYFHYDTAGRLTAVELQLVDDPATPNVDPEEVRPRYEYFYDNYGNQIGILDPLGRMTVFKYNELQQQTAKYTPFEFDDPTPGDGGITIGDIYTALALDQPAPAEETRTYDEYGRLDVLIDFKGQATVFTYNSRGLLEDERYFDAGQEPQLGSNIHYTYDSLSRTLTKTITEFDPSEAAVYSRCYENVYNVEGAVQAVNIYDELDSHALVDSVGYAHDPISGRQIGVFTPNGDTGVQETYVGYAYDALGRLANVQTHKRNNHEPSPDEIAEYYYNPVGSRQEIKYPNGNVAAYTYDALNRLETLTNYADDSPTAKHSEFAYAVAADGMRTTVIESFAGEDQRTIEYEYDNLNRILNETAGADLKGYSTEYTYDLAGNRMQRVVTVIGAEPGVLTTTYSYDPDTDRLLSEVHVGPEWAVLLGDRRFYAYADGSGGIVYKTGKGEIGSFKAFMLGLPTKWSQHVLRTVLLLLPMAFCLPAIVVLLARLRRRPAKDRSRLSLFYRCVSVMLAYAMLISSVGLQQLAEGDTQYSNLYTMHWGEGNRTIEYDYDDNGSMISKTTAVTGGATLETITYEYNLQDRLAKVTKSAGAETTITEYKYDPDGNRVQKTVDDGTDVVVTDYLIDAYNHTGYAQVFHETTTTNGDPATMTRTAYTIGDDVISQGESVWELSPPDDWHWTAPSVQYLLYDGHGSTRQLSDNTGALVTGESYSYDAYGVMLGGNPGSESNPGSPATNLLYSGEQWDTSAQQYYLRARYYDPLTGRFNRTDPYPGSPQDPQSLHKYIYCHNNPVNGIDPTGEQFSYAERLTVTGVIGELIAAAAPYIKIGLPALTTLVALKIVYELAQEYVASGLTAVASVIMSNTKAVVKAINDVAKAIGRTVKQLLKFKLFPIIRRLTPKIFDFNVAVLATHPHWFKLDYNGAGNPLTGFNRLWVAARYGYMMATAPPGYQLDEFPYACTAQGGRFGPALARPAPAWENALQGGYLGAFARWTLKGAPQPFIVVPIPL